MYEEYLPTVIRELEQLKRLADGALAQLPAEHFFTVPGPADNSIAVIVKHVSGNMRSRWTGFLTEDGEKPDRNRDGEFMILPEDTREDLLRRWEAGWATLFGSLRPLVAADFQRKITIRGEPLSVVQAINRQHTHYAYHVGQLVFLAKHFVGAGWKSLSIPLGQSETFNRAPTPYLPKN